MEHTKSTYYLICDRIVGRSICDGTGSSKDQLYTNGKWVPDEMSVIMDHLLGFDSSEPADSPYAIGNTEMLDEIREITEAEALALTERRSGAIRAEQH